MQPIAAAVEELYMKREVCKFANELHHLCNLSV